MEGALVRRTSPTLTQRWRKRIWRSHPTPSGLGPWVVFVGVSAPAEARGRVSARSGRASVTEGVRGHIATSPGGRTSPRRGAPPEELPIAASTRTERRPDILATSPPGGDV